MNFEFNKTIVLYIATILLMIGWMLSSLWGMRLITDSAFLLPSFVLFLLASGVAAVFSIDRHASLWGYYGRFNGGLISLTCYFLLYLIAATTLPAQSKNPSSLRITPLLVAMTIAAFLVAGYCVLQHFGIDDHLWVQDVQSRVFSTLRQPNWLAAYLTAVFPIAISLSITGSRKRHTMLGWVGVALILYLALLYTKSRSGFLAFIAVYIIFWIDIVSNSFLDKKGKNSLKTSFILLSGVLTIITVLTGSPFTKANQLFEKGAGLFGFENKAALQEPQQTTGNITDSGKIRSIIWRGALRAIAERPLFGWGPETFAWVYYRFKPVEHNLTSEWDFLYNKAHNEYLHLAATTGVVGLSSYLVMIGAVIVWYYRALIVYRRDDTTNQRILRAGLFYGWLSLLITNFFGFSVVVTALLFFLLPAIMVCLIPHGRPKQVPLPSVHLLNETCVSLAKPTKKIVSILIVTFGVLSLVFVTRLWLADVSFAKAEALIRSDDPFQAYPLFIRAIALNPFEPMYQSEFTTALSLLAISSAQEEDFEQADRYAKQAIRLSDRARETAPANVSFWKTRTWMYYTLSALDPSYLEEAVHSLEVARELSPTDPKILYNLAILLEEQDKQEESVSLLKRALELKPDYRDAAWGLVVFYEEQQNSKERDHWLEYILKNIDPNDQEAQQKLLTRSIQPLLYRSTLIRGFRVERIR